MTQFKNSWRKNCKPTRNGKDGILFLRYFSINQGRIYQFLKKGNKNKKEDKELEKNGDGLTEPFIRPS